MNDLFEQPRDSPSDLSPLPTCAKSVLRSPAVLIKCLIQGDLPVSLSMACPLADHWLLRAAKQPHTFSPITSRETWLQPSLRRRTASNFWRLKQTFDAPTTRQRPSRLPLPTSENLNCHNCSHFEALNDTVSLTAKVLVKVTVCSGKLQICCK